MVGSSLKRKFEGEGYKNIIYKNSTELNLINQFEVEKFFKREKPDHVLLAAAKVGGIIANSTYKAEFIYNNLMIQANIINSSYIHGVKKLLFLGSSCIYPKFAPQPLKEDSLLSGFLEPTNKPYAIAKIAGIELCESYRFQYNCNFISAMPTNLYGTNDNYHPTNSHVIPALIRRFVEAKKQQKEEVLIWDSGTPRREFLHVDDLADACYSLMKNYNESSTINIGTGKDLSISELAFLISNLVGFKGKINFDHSKPDGSPVKVLDVSKINKLGWSSKISLKDGLVKTIKEYTLLNN